MASRKTVILLATLVVVGTVTAAWWNFIEINPRANARDGARAEIAWLTDHDAALAQARSDGKLVVVDFFATWCGPCKMMERNTFTDSNVQRRVAGFVPLKIDVDRQPEIGVRTWFNLPDRQTTVDVTEYKGKVVYLYGFQSWCPGGHSQGFPTLTKLIKHYEGNQDVAFVAVQTTFEGYGTNTPEAARETAKRYGLSIPVGHSGSREEASTVMQRYRTGGTPWTVIIDRNGVVRYNDFHVQPENAINLIDRLLTPKRRVNGSANNLARAMERLT